MKDINYIQAGERLRVFDYFNEVFDEVVFISIIDIVENTIVYERYNGERLMFGTGYFETINTL